MSATLTRNAATERQVAYLISLWERKAEREQQIDPENGPEAALATHEGIADIREGRWVISKREASEMIDRAKTWLTAHPVREAAVPRVAAVAEGLYILDNIIYRVQRSRTGNLYAKRLVPGGRQGRFEYAPGAMRNLTGADVLTAERAAEWGRQERQGHDGAIRVYCACCGAELDTQESRDRGIGPVCYRRNFC